ncbi:DUF1826 domain-containing protein [Kushneria konosiri]|uniref:Succinylglutamate desuccinylase n=1 Tax=Kushneria konosiri TaxID=698828 RepID=A0A2Z2H644_9GAMM|nr:DUF1826 domain-containing protein [Kushneria konosiri]ARS52825.1 hypothetical protein B9G99_07990 [Kushneria konosiri]
MSPSSTLETPEPALLMARELATIFDADREIAIAARTLTADLAASVDAQCRTARGWSIALEGAPEAALEAELRERLPVPEQAQALVEDVMGLARLMASMLEATELRLRLRLLEDTMCPRFHCDNVAVRLVTSWLGPGSEWLPEHALDRRGLGAPSSDKPAIVVDSTAIERLDTGDVALIKGSAWHGEGRGGLVHRSPALEPGQRRLMMSIDPL